MIRINMVLLMMVFSWEAMASKLMVRNGEILPVSLVNANLETFLDDYARVTKIRLSYSEDLVRKRDKINLTLSSSVKIDKFHEYVLKLLASKNLGMIDEAGGKIIVDQRDMRYLPAPFYFSSDFPKTNAFLTVLHRMDYPFGVSAVRGLRPLISRYGRVISFEDNKTILINDMGSTIRDNLKLVERLDTRSSYQASLADREKKALELAAMNTQEREIQRLKEEVEKLERENRKMEKKKGKKHD